MEIVESTRSLLLVVTYTIVYVILYLLIVYLFITPLFFINQSWEPGAYLPPDFSHIVVVVYSSA
jgi:hypothetical protein